MVLQYATLAGLGRHELHGAVLPALKAAGIIDYVVDGDGTVTNLDEYVGVSASLLVERV